jgi:SAM-dependent methyltransferase
MESTRGAATFQTTGAAYDAFMGRYSRQLAEVFADAAHVTDGQRALDVGCGPGAMTGVLAARLGASSVAACDPSEPFVAGCRARHPGVDVRLAPAEALPFDDDDFDVALAQLVLHFVSDADAAAREFHRVVRRGGIIGACVWDFAERMEMLRQFWDAALELDENAPDEAKTLRFGREGEIAELFAAAGLVDIEESTLRVSSAYRDFDELWAGFLKGIGPAGAYCVSRPEDQRVALKAKLFERLGTPVGPFTLNAMARAAVGRVPA